MANKMIIVPDLEGHFEYLVDLMQKGYGISYDQENKKFNIPKGTTVIFMGDIGDEKSPVPTSQYGDLDVLTAISNTQKQFPSQVIELLGNRDINKLRFLVELFCGKSDTAVEDIDVDYIKGVLVKELTLIEGGLYLTSDNKGFIGAGARYKADPTLAWMDGGVKLWFGQFLSKAFGRKQELTAATSKEELMERYQTMIGKIEASAEQNPGAIGAFYLSWMLSETMGAGMDKRNGNLFELRAEAKRQRTLDRMFTEKQIVDTDDANVPFAITDEKPVTALQSYHEMMGANGSTREYLKNAVMIHSEQTSAGLNVVVTHGAIGPDSDKCGPSDTADKITTKQVKTAWDGILRVVLLGIQNVFDNRENEYDLEADEDFQSAYKALQEVALAPDVHQKKSFVQYHVAMAGVIPNDSWAHRVFFEEQSFHITAHTPQGDQPAYRRYIDEDGRLSYGMTGLFDSCNYRANGAYLAATLEGKMHTCGGIDQKGQAFEYAVNLRDPDLLVGLPLMATYYPQNMQSNVTTALDSASLQPNPVRGGVAWSVAGINRKADDFSSNDLDPTYILERLGDRFALEVKAIKRSELLKFAKTVFSAEQFEAIAQSPCYPGIAPTMQLSSTPQLAVSVNGGAAAAAAASAPNTPLSAAPAATTFGGGKGSTPPPVAPRGKVEITPAPASSNPFG
jgi:hypothetical protein